MAINIKFIMKNVFEMLKISSNNIKITKSQTPSDFYEQCWFHIQSLIGVKINSTFE